LVRLCDLSSIRGPVTDRFQIFAGTSIGGLMACALAVGIAPRRVLDAIDASGPYIFVPKPVNFFKRFIGKAPYDSYRLSEAVKQCLRQYADMPISQVDAALLVPAINWTTGQTHVFMSASLGAAHASNATLYDVCMSSSAAPTFFAPHQAGEGPMLDGGLVANNPDMLVLSEVQRRWPNEIGRVEMLSIGTAGAATPRPPEKAMKSMPGWGRSLATFMMDVQEVTASSQATRLLGSRYLRMNHLPASGEAAFERLDLADDASRSALFRASDATAQEAYKRHRAFIDRMLSPSSLTGRQ
ncbi:Patatin, partial [sediment metagenome]